MPPLASVSVTTGVPVCAAQVREGKEAGDDDRMEMTHFGANSRLRGSADGKSCTSCPLRVARRSPTNVALHFTSR